MRSFLIRLSLFMGILVSAIVCAAVLMPHNPTAYLYMQRRKMQRLDTLSSPRLILVGGSNVAYGLDSRMLQDSLHLHPVNAGLQSGIGLKFMIDDVSLRLRHGDVVVLMPEYAQFLERYYYGQPEGLAPAVMYDGAYAFGLLNARQWAHVLTGLPKYILVNLRRMPAEPGNYSAHGFNEFGDEAGHRVCPGRKTVAVDTDAYSGPVSPHVCRMVASQIRSMRREGCRVYLLPQISIRSNYDHNRPVVDSIYSLMAALGEPFAMQAPGMVVPDTLAFDSPNHVNASGVKISTGRLIRFLRRQGV